MDKGGKSLRKKKADGQPPKISDPLPNRSRAQYRDNASTRTASTERGPQGAKTSDLVKRRYSTRFNQIPQDGAPPMPGLPPMPAQFKDKPRPSQDGRPPGSSSGQRIAVETRALKDPNLVPEKYVASILADASEQDIQEYQNDLRKMQSRNTQELQHNVYQNRTQFIKISKDAEKLKEEMRTLRNLMSEVTGIVGQATAASSSSETDAKAKRRANRSSVANLEALWNTHLQTLWKRVEGSQKFLPAAPGRHIIYESGRWVELNAATWKARRRVYLILLNDHLLLASEKKRLDAAANTPQSNLNNTNDPRQKRTQQQTQLVADRCFPLQDVHLTDIGARPPTAGITSPTNPPAASSSAQSSAINIRVGTQSFTFAVSSSQDAPEKAKFITNLRKASEDLRKQLASETETREKARESVNYYATRSSGLWKRADLIDGLNERNVNIGSPTPTTASSTGSSMLLDVSGHTRSIRDIEAEIDGLDIDIALQRFEDAVPKVEALRETAKGIRGNAWAQDVVTFKVDERSSKLAGVLVRGLCDDSACGWGEHVRKHVGWMTRLGEEARARDGWLNARSGVIRKRARQCTFTGSLPHYLSQLAYVYFTLIANTLTIFSTAFPPATTSAAVVWAKQHVDEFNEILARQLSSVERDSETWKEAMNSTKKQAAILGEVGLEFGDLVGKDIEESADGANGDAKGIGLGVKP
ncbi:MAG: exocyst complex component exo84 [Bogoriella megaspora]|nr:MAG: exocyst complex component exo84 [Bogoriella megaspora]